MGHMESDGPLRLEKKNTHTLSTHTFARVILGWPIHRRIAIKKKTRA